MRARDVTTDGDGWHEAWGLALDALELESDQVERLLAERTSWETVPEATLTFRAPVGLGPLPLYLGDRARALLQRQLDLSAELTTAIHTNRQQAMLAARLQQAQTDPRPIFVDRAD